MHIYFKSFISPPPGDAFDAGFGDDVALDIAGFDGVVGHGEVDFQFAQAGGGLEVDDELQGVGVRFGGVDGEVENFAAFGPFRQVVNRVRVTPPMLKRLT